MIDSSRTRFNHIVEECISERELSCTRVRLSIELLAGKLGNTNYQDNAIASPSPQPNSLGWDLGRDGKLWSGRNGRSGRLSHSSVAEIGDLHVCMYMAPPIVGANLVGLRLLVKLCGCMFNGNVVMVTR